MVRYELMTKNRQNIVSQNVKINEIKKQSLQALSKGFKSNKEIQDKIQVILPVIHIEKGVI